jgi:opacity protein-like surface antigen
MKQLKYGAKASTFILGLVLMNTAPSILAQDDGQFLDDGSDIYNSEQIDIDGNYSQKETAADRISQMRKKLEKENEQMVQKKIEDIRIGQEQELAQKLSSAFNGQTQNNNDYSNSEERYDDVGTLSAAPQRIEAIDLEDNDSNLRNKIIPTVGMKNFDGSRIDSFSAKTNVGLTFENMLSNYFSLGVGVSYTAMDISYVEYGSLFNYYNSVGYNPTTSDEVSYQNINVNFGGKVFFTADTMIKPFIAATVGYNRTRLRFEERTTNFYNYNNQQDDTSVSGSNVTATGIVGAEFNFAKNVGLVADFRFTKGLTNGFDTLNSAITGSAQVDNDKRVLKDVGSRLERSDIASVNLGLVVKF